MTSAQLWEGFRSAIRELAVQALAANRTMTTSVRVRAGSVFISANIGSRSSGAKAKPPYSVEWVGPWDSRGRILLDANFERLTGIARRAA